jgi:putative protein-disulfide isomerase
MVNTKLHYIFDPLCGWCYAASPLLTALNERFGDELELVFHPGLLFAEPRSIDTSYREHIISADLRIAALAGVGFGIPYINRVRTAPVLRYHSEPPAVAIMAVNALQPELGLPMLEAIQKAHYQQGEDVSDLLTLSNLARTMGLDVEAFAQAQINVQQILPGIAAEARNLMHAVGGNGFPTLVLERDGEFQKLDHNSTYGKPYVLSNSVARLIGMPS